MSPLRGSSKWDEVHQDAITSYAMRASQPSSSDNTVNKDLNQKAQLGGGHKKCYYEEMSSVVRSRLAGLMIMVAEEELSIERQR